MSDISTPAPETAAGSLAGNASGSHALITAFALALFTSASLLFVVQPMFAKLILPKLGGSPAVWSVATVFFQGVLLCGYGYAHILTTKLNIRQAALTHMGLMALVIAFTLPIGIASGWDTPSETQPALWLVGLFAASIGLPFFAVSANGPLLQAWFSRSGHRHAADPYFLYGASNIGSLAALLAYPFLIEPNVTLTNQLRGWSWGFAFLLALIAFAASFVVRKKSDADEQVTEHQSAPLADRLTWIGLAAVPSGLLVAYTAHVSTDVAAVPFLWVIPLALFLLTFIIAFQRKPWVPAVFARNVMPLAFIAGLVSLRTSVAFPAAVNLILSSISFFILALNAHHELVARRPGTRNLTQFYFYMSLGGVIGGSLAALAAPAIFNNTYEYPILLFAALSCQPMIWQGRPLTVALRLGILTAMLLVFLLGEAHLQILWSPVPKFMLLGTVVLLFWFLRHNRPASQIVIGGATALLLAGNNLLEHQTISTSRSFFGVHSVRETKDGTYRMLAHGTTVHGAARLIRDAQSDRYGKHEPLTYYNPEGAIASAFELARQSRPVRSIGIVGLGAGTMACHAQAGESWRFFEIDPEVIRIARDPNMFRFLSDCAPTAPIVLGDARLTLGKEANGAKDLLLIDAFSSDSIPVHLMTREAVQLYFRKLSADGILVMHISNRHLELQSVVAALADEMNIAIRARNDVLFQRDQYDRQADGNMPRMWMPSLTVVFGRDAATLSAFTPDKGWKDPARTKGVAAWSDDYSDIISAMSRPFTN